MSTLTPEMKEGIKEYLKENLYIEVGMDEEYDYSTKYLNLSINIKLENDIVAEGNAYISL